MGHDLLVICFISLLAEYFIMKDKYVLFSPFFIFHVSFLYIYIMPLSIYGMSDTLNFLNRLEYSDVLHLCNQIRLFYYIFVLISFFSLKKLSKKGRMIGIEMPRLTNNFVLLSIVLLTLVSFFVDLWKVNFSFGTFINMLLNPRSYTYLREGLGPLTYMVNFSKMFILFVCVIYFLQHRNFFSICALSYGIIINLLGGSKTSLFIVIIFVIIFRQKIKKTRMNFAIFLLTIVSFLFVAIISFTIMSGSREVSSLKEAVNFIIEYAQEAYYSARVIKDFDWSANNIIIELRSLLLTPVPRALFGDKALYGFYQECWRNVYQEGAVIYQSSTYGFLSEAHMLFGKIAPYVSALAINLFLYRVSDLYNKANSIFSLFITGYLFTRVYFFTRSGYLEATNIWALVLFVFFAYLFVSIINGRHKEHSNAKINSTCS